MGAETFQQLVVTKGNARDAYKEAREEANEYNGHQEGYSGDIQTTSGFRDITNIAPRYGTKSFSSFVEDCLDNDKYVEKRGSCACVEVKGTKLKTMKERRGLKGKKGYKAFYFFGWGAC